MTIAMEGLASLTDSALVALVNGLWQGVALALAVWCFFRVTSFSNAATRYAVWWVVMLTIVALPVLIGLTPSKRPRASQVKEPLSSPSAPMLVLSQTADANRLPSFGSPAPSDPEMKAPSLEGAVPLPSPRKMAGWFPLRLAPRRWSAYVVAGWLFITLVMLGRVGWSYFQLRQLKKASAPLGPPCQECLNEWLASSGFSRPVALRSSERVCGPMAAGLAQPAIVFPLGLAERLNEEELDQLVLHELAHLHRRDDWTNLGQKIVEALFFFHPAVRFVGRQLNMEREIACDDWAITQTGKPKPYAACLTKLVELTGRVETPALASGGWTTRKQIVRRIEMSLNRSRNSSPRLSRASILVSLAVLVLVGVQAARTSPLVVAALTYESPYESPNESVYARAVGAPWASEEETPEANESQSEAERTQAEAAQELRDHAERLEHEALERSQQIERQMRRQQ